MWQRWAGVSKAPAVLRVRCETSVPCSPSSEGTWCHEPWTSLLEIIPKGFCPCGLACPGPRTLAGLFAHQTWPQEGFSSPWLASGWWPGLRGGVGTGSHSPPLKTGTCPDRSWHREASLSLTAALPSLVGVPPGAATIQGLQDSNFTFCRMAEFQVLETRSLG